MAERPAAEYDSPWKEALTRYLPEALSLFFPAVAAQSARERGFTLLDQEPQPVTHDADLGRRPADLLAPV